MTTPSLHDSPPTNVDAERGLLGAIFVDNYALERVSDFLKPAHFALGQHAHIFDVCIRLVDRGQIANPITLKSYFEQNDELDVVGGPSYLAELAANAVTVFNAGEYGRIVHELYLRRELIRLSHDIALRASNGKIDDHAALQIESAEQGLYELASHGVYDGGPQLFDVALRAAIDRAEIAHKQDGGLAGVTTGLSDLDELLGGLHPSDLIVLAGRPAMGKTALATNIAFNSARAHLTGPDENGAIVLFFSLEMSAEQLAGRILSEQAEVTSDRIRKGMLSEDEFPALVIASQSLNKLPIFIDDTPALSISALRTRARRLKRNHSIGLIVIDYIQLITGSAESRRGGRVQEISEITRGLKTIAKELNIPILALSQLSRQVENRDDKRPQLADLRESGTIEQDADIVAFIYREEYYLEKAEPQTKPDEENSRYLQRLSDWELRIEEVRNNADVMVAKQRHGPIGTVKLRFKGEFTKFSNTPPA